MTRPNLPIRTRLTLVFAGLLATVLTAAGLLLYLGLAAQLDSGINEDVKVLAGEFAADIASGETDVLSDFGVAEPTGSFALVLGPQLATLEASRSAEGLAIVEPAPAPIKTPGLHDGVVRRGAETEPELARLYVMPAEGGKLVIVGQLLDDRNAALKGLALMLAIGGPLVLAIVSGIAWHLSGAALAPVERMRQEASAISLSDPGKRLEVPPTGDEISGLAATLNTMLARLEAAFEKERRFVDDASHELRTPLGILTTELELALRRARTHGELRAALASATKTTGGLNRLAEDMLVLARSDRGKLQIHKSRIALAALVAETVGYFGNRADENGVRLKASAPPGLEADADETRLRQALGNLIDNALAHTPAGGTIRVAAAADGATALAISVADSGPGFPEGFAAKAFDPFVRADKGRSRDGGGAGLGLAIVKGVAEAHGGSVEAGNLPGGGAIVTMRLPV